MTIDELAASLPNGLHDAELRTVEIDFIKREVRLDLNIWIGDSDHLEAYRLAQMKICGLLFWVTEPPDSRYPFSSSSPLRIDVGPLTDIQPEKLPNLPAIPECAFANWFFVNDWNAFIYVAAERACLTWLGERTVGE